MKILFNRKPVSGPWGGGNFFLIELCNFLTKLGHDVVFTIQNDIDVFFIMDPRPSDDGIMFDDILKYRYENPSVKIIHRINDTDKARPYAPPTREQYFIKVNEETDHTIFISEWVRDHYISRGFNSEYENTVIINGCNSKYYYPKENSIGNSIKLITHHWGDGPLKGFDIYNYLDTELINQPAFVFTYLGRYNKDYQPKNINLIPPQPPKEIGNILRENDIYITGARWEACGMHHIEAARCGLPVLYHKDGGAVPEVCRKHGIEYYDEMSLFYGLQKIVDNYDSYRSKIDYDYLSMDRCCKEYLEVIENV